MENHVFSGVPGVGSRKPGGDLDVEFFRGKKIGEMKEAFWTSKNEGKWFVVCPHFLSTTRREKLPA
jgi:hypothetical protein